MNEFEEYADWYVWAKRNLSANAEVCHGAADAATAAIGAGGDRQQAIAAARQSLASAAHLGVAAADVRRRTYAEWFDWSRRELGGVREQQHAAAGAALATLDAGRGANAATAAARAAHDPAQGPPRPAAPAYMPPPPPPSSGPQPPYGGPPAPVPAPVPVMPPAPPPPPGYLPYPTAPPPAAFAGYAGFWRRFAAWVIDWVLVSVAVGFPVGFAFGTVAAFRGQQIDQTAVDLVIYPLTVLTNWLYFTICEASGWQGTLGKLALRIKVTDLEGRRFGWGRANARYWSKVLSWLILAIGFLMIAFTERKQGLHDMIAATLVVRREA